MGRIRLVGLEVEGGWNGKKGESPFDIPIIADHSIDGRTLISDNPLTCPHIGEIVSKPMFPDPDLIGAWIDKYWPHYTNNTCGYHIHMSFHNKQDYVALTTKTFLLDVVLAMRLKGIELGLRPTHYLFTRLSGVNPFTTLNFDASSQISLKRKSIGNRVRYGILNFAWNIHGTVEWRAFPTFEKAEQARLLTFAFMSFVEDWLEKNSRKFIKSYSVILNQTSGQCDYQIVLPKEVA